MGRSTAMLVETLGTYRSTNVGHADEGTAKGPGPETRKP